MSRRCFVAVDLPKAFRADMVRWQRLLPVGRAVDAEALHLTLAFLDTVEDDLLQELDLGLSAIRAGRLPLRAGNLGVFSGSATQGIHVQVDPDPALEALAAQVRRLARQTGIALARERFRPHVTLVRFSARESRSVAPRLTDLLPIHMPVAPAEAVSFSLCESTLRAGGAVYTPLAVYPLGVS